MKMVIFLTLGIICTILGVLGVLLPVMPGLIFFAMAGYFLQKSSPAMHQKLLKLPYVGQAMKDWENYAVMSFQTKFSLVSFCFVTSSVMGYFYRANLSVGIILYNLSFIALFTIIAIDKKIP